MVTPERSTSLVLRVTSVIPWASTAARHGPLRRDRALMGPGNQVRDGGGRARKPEQRKGGWFRASHQLSPPVPQYLRVAELEPDRVTLRIIHPVARTDR